MTERRRGSAELLCKKLAGWFDVEWGELPSDKREVVRQRFPLSWESLTPRQRRKCASDLDEQHPTDAVEKERAELHFLLGFRRVSLPQRGKRNASRPRPSRQVVSDDQLRRLEGELRLEGVKHHNRCSEAHRRFTSNGATRISIQAFRRRWNRIGLNIKKKEP